MSSDPLLGVRRGGPGWEERAVPLGVQLRHTDDASETGSLGQKSDVLGSVFCIELCVAV